MSQVFCRTFGIHIDYVLKPLLLQLNCTKLSSYQLNQVRLITNRKRDPHKRSFPQEAKPDYDLVGSGSITEGEIIIPPPVPTLTDVEEVNDPDLWKYVERILPRKTIPNVPQHTSYPTPSGWVPPTEESGKLPYHVARNKYHHFPIYLEVMDGGTRKMTCIKRVNGDIWALEGELRKHLEDKIQAPMFTQVDEVCLKLRVRGNFMEEVSEFLLQKGL